ncbi:MAG: hypothetical protein AAFQ94_09575 [Bacteroidota bacterium]
MRLLFHNTTITKKSVTRLPGYDLRFPTIGSISLQSIFKVSSHQSSLKPIKFCHYNQLTSAQLTAHHYVQNVFHTLFQLNQNRSHLSLQSGTQGVSYNLKNGTPSYLVFQGANFTQLPFTKPEFQ